MSELTKNGISTTTQKGQFAWEEFRPSCSIETRVQWDYRDANGVLHSGIAKTLEDAKQAARRYGFQLSNCARKMREVRKKEASQ